MAIWIDKDSICTKGKIPLDFGYFRVSLYDGRKYLDRGPSGIYFEEAEWIVENIEGKWMTWNFGSTTTKKIQDGQSFAFLLEEDAMAFKLRFG